MGESDDVKAEKGDTRTDSLVERMAQQAERLNTLSDAEWEAIEDTLRRTLALSAGLERFTAVTEALDHILARRQPVIEYAFLLTSLTSDSTELDAGQVEQGWTEETRMRIRRLRLLFGYWIPRAFSRDVRREKDWTTIHVVGEEAVNADGSMTPSIRFEILRIDGETLTLEAGGEAFIRLVATLSEALSHLDTAYFTNVTDDDRAAFVSGHHHLETRLQDARDTHPSQREE